MYLPIDLLSVFTFFAFAAINHSELHANESWKTLARYLNAVLMCVILGGKVALFVCFMLPVAKQLAAYTNATQYYEE